MQSLHPLLLAGLGGFVGSAGRYAIGGFVHRLLPFAAFPVGTLVVNVAGCFLIGVVAGLVDARQLFSPDLRVFLMVGVLGGFTTFSSFAYETLALARDASFARAAVNIAAQVILGLTAAWLGYAAGRG